MKQAEREGIILKGIGGFYYVLCGETTLECKAGGRLRLLKETPVAGDHVVLLEANGRGMIIKLQPRKNYLARPPIANIDQLIIVASQSSPKTEPFLLDQLSVLALWQGLTPIIVLNKSDLDSNDRLYETYSTAGFITLRVSAVTGEGVQELQELLTGKITAFTGNSGIGKSSLLNRIDSRLALPTGEISERIARGKQTTRKVELFLVAAGGLVADTPGFSAFELDKTERIKKDMLEHYFPEIGAQFGSCRFSGCAHIDEPGCDIKKLVDEGKIARSRYDSYVRLYLRLKEQKDWEEQ